MEGISVCISSTANGRSDVCSPLPSRRFQAKFQNEENKGVGKVDKGKEQQAGGARDISRILDNRYPFQCCSICFRFAWALRCASTHAVTD
ncbi:Hypothetical predicted protein, partial [Podarcis lilfordi]